MTAAPATATLLPVRRGRPRKHPDDVRNVNVQLRLTAWEMAWLTDNATREGVSVSDYIRDSIGLPITKVPRNTNAADYQARVAAGIKSLPPPN